MNKLTAMGYVGVDPKVITPKKDEFKPFTVFTINTEEKGSNISKYNRDEWHNLIVRGALGEVCMKHVSKGDRVAIEGRVQNKSFKTDKGEKRKQTEIVVEKIYFVSNKKRQKDEYDL